MDYRICMFLLAASLSYTEQCKESFDKTRCYYNLVCEDIIENIRYIYGYSSSSYNIPNCSGTYDLNGNSLYPLNIVFHDTRKDHSTPVPIIYNDYEEHVQIIYSLDLSPNNYDYTPVIISMPNLEILNISNNQLTEGLLSNDNNLAKLRELDLSYNTINSLVVHRQRYPYITLTKLDISHNDLEKIPDAVFEQFDRLQTLDLSHNFIEDLNQFTFEGVKNLLHLNLSNNRLTGIGSSLLRLSKLRVLNLSGNRMKHVKLRDLEKLNALEVLDLSSNFIDTIFFYVFHDMVVLQRLDLSNNLLTVVSKDAFANLQSLTSIDLSRNKLKSLPKGLFKNSSIYTFSISDNLLEGSLAKGMFEGVNVSTLDLSNQLLKDIQDYAFYELIRLQTLLLNNNEIQSLSTMCFKTLIRLEHLDLSNNQIVSIDFNKDDLRSLRTISLTSNLLTLIKHEYFQHLSSLEYLNLSKNNISRLEPGSFKSLSNLVNLDVLGNSLIRPLDSNTFDGLISLPSLDMSFNLLTTIQNASFNSMNMLKVLNMSYGEIKKIHYNAFINTGQIETLDLSHNKLENLFINMTDLLELGTLLLNNNLLKSIYTPYLQSLSWQTTYNLENNETNDLRNESFIRLINLRYLDLSYNEKLNFSDSLLRNVKYLVYLDLSGVKTDFHFKEMNVSELFEVTISNAGLRNISLLNLRTLKHLNTLILSSNNVTKLEVGALLGMDTLKHLDLSFNKISFIQPGVFRDNNNLMWLNISHNSLSEIGYGIFRGLNNLKILDMSYNNIKDIKNERFYEVERISELIVDHNRIESISFADLSDTHLTKISIGDNPLPCHILVNLLHTGIWDKLTSIKLDEHNAENINGITCNKNQDEESIKSKNYKYVINENSNQVIDESKYLQSILIAIDKINDEKFTNLASMHNITNMLLKEILKSLNKTTDVVKTTSVPAISDNKSVDVISYVNNMNDELKQSISVEKQNIINKLQNKTPIFHHAESFSTSPSNEKFVTTNKETKSLFTETCVALILIILVGIVLYKLYKSRMFIRNRFSISARELPSDMENSAL